MTKKRKDFPGGTVDKNPPVSAGEMVWSLVQEDWKIPHALEQLSPWATTTEPALYRFQELQPLKPMSREPVLHNKEKPLQWEAYTWQQSRLY